MERANERGFTLMELVVVLAILLITSAIVLPELSQRLQEERFLSAVYQVHSDLRLAQEAAKRDQCLVRMSFYPKDGRTAYQIYLLDTEHTLVKAESLPKGVQLNYGQDSTVIFTGDGHIQKNGHLLLYQGKKRYFIYFYQSGRVRVNAQKI